MAADKKKKPARLAADGKKSRCNETQANRRAPDFTCTSEEGSHGVHTDPSGLRWGHPEKPRGVRRKVKK